MSKKHEYYLKKCQILIKECRASGMSVVEWCAANNLSKYKYYYWLEKIRTECYEEAIAQLQPIKATGELAISGQMQTSTFVEITPETINAIPKQANFGQPVAVVQTGNIRIEIMPNAPSSFIRQLLEAARYA